MNSDAYQAAHHDVVARDMSRFGRFRVWGSEAANLLHHLTTNDVKGMAPQTAIETVLVSTRGRVLDWLTVLRTGHEEFLVVTSPNRREMFEPHAWRFILFRQDVHLEDVTAQTRLTGYFGPNAGLLDAKTLKLPTRRLPGGGFLQLGDPIEGVKWCDDDTYNVLRVEAGVPVAGLELTDDVNPWEAGLNFAVSLHKGCYNGQEVIARLNTYQKIKQRLHLVTLERPVDRVPLPLLHEGALAGTLTSWALSPLEGAIGLAYVRSKYEEGQRALRTAEDQPQAVVWGGAAGVDVPDLKT